MTVGRWGKTKRSGDNGGQERGIGTVVGEDEQIGEEKKGANSRKERR